jgi:hypothetical protein
MKKKISEIDDWIRPEYDLSKLTVVARGPGRKVSDAAVTVALEPDVAKLFPTAKAVNDALRMLGQIACESKPRIG